MLSFYFQVWLQAWWSRWWTIPFLICEEIKEAKGSPTFLLKSNLPLVHPWVCTTQLLCVGLMWYMLCLNKKKVLSMCFFKYSHLISCKFHVFFTWHPIWIWKAFAKLKNIFTLFCKCTKFSKFIQLSCGHMAASFSDGFGVWRTCVFL